MWAVASSGEHCSCGKVEVSSALSGPDQPYLKTEFSRAGCILMLMLRDLLDMSAKTRFFFFFFKTFFPRCSSVTACCAQSAVMDGTCLIHFVSQDWFLFLAEGNETGEGWEKISKGD